MGTDVDSLFMTKKITLKGHLSSITITGNPPHICLSQGSEAVPYGFVFQRFFPFNPPPHHHPETLGRAETAEKVTFELNTGDLISLGHQSRPKLVERAI